MSCFLLSLLNVYSVTTNHTVTACHTNKWRTRKDKSKTVRLSLTSVPKSMDRTLSKHWCHGQWSVCEFISSPCGPCTFWFHSPAHQGNSRQVKPVTCWIWLSGLPNPKKWWQIAIGLQQMKYTDVYGAVWFFASRKELHTLMYNNGKRNEVIYVHTQFLLVWRKSHCFQTPCLPLASQGGWFNFDLTFLKSWLVISPASSIGPRSKEPLSKAKRWGSKLPSLLSTNTSRLCW